MSDEEGIPRPPRPTPPAPSIPKDPGVQRGIVKDSLSQTDGHAFDASDPIAKWRDRLSGLATTGRPMSGPHAPGGPNVFDSITTHGEKLFGGSSLEAAKAALSFLTQPVRTITHDYQAAKMDRLREEFLAKNGPTMTELNQAMGTFENRSLRMTYLNDEAAKIAGNSVLAKQLLEKKAALGDELASQIDAAMENASPEDREKLRGLKNDLDSWMKDRDARVEAEKPEIDELLRRTEALQKAFYNQHDALAQASETAHYVRDGAHTHPQSLAFAAALRNLLVASRVSISEALSGEE